MYRSENPTPLHVGGLANAFSFIVLVFPIALNAVNSGSPTN